MAATDLREPGTMPSECDLFKYAPLLYAMYIEWEYKISQYDTIYPILPCPRTSFHLADTGDFFF